ncbi:MAG TPA: tRNA lysidine(34) synthetase TilS [Gemmatimonadales bacterium]|nr:tRNA lysidine(34) synthetase TilS [Gemmatimonadales bacterium]
MTAGLVDRFREHVARARLLPEPGTALVAVSGGPDSVALLDLLDHVALELGLTLVVAHADHGMQADSRTVGQAVRDLAARFVLPFESVELRLGPGASETVARRARYRWLREVQRTRGARYLVTAHQRDDQVETILWRALKGSGMAGLAGIPARGQGGLVRPLLPFSKTELVAYAAARDLPVHDDPANRDPRHARSWLRAVLLPQLMERFGETVGRDLLRLGRHARADRRGWDRVLQLLPELALRVTSNGVDVARGPLVGYDPAVSRALLAAAARQAGLVLGPEKARRVLGLGAGGSGRRVELGAGWVAEAEFDRLRIHRPREVAPQLLAEPGERGEAVFGEFVVRWEAAAVPEQAALERTGWSTWIGGDEASWELRTPRAGDRMVPLGGVGNRTVRRLLMEARVPRGARQSYPVIARGETILWVPGVCRSAADLPVPGTQGLRLDVIEHGRPAADGRQESRPGGV